MTIEGVDETFACSKKGGTVVIETYNYPLDGGDVEFTVTANFSDGSRATDSVKAFVSNRTTQEVEAVRYDFTDDLQGFELEAASQAKFGDKGVYHSKDIGDGGALVFDTIWSGAQDWQELRVINRNIPEIAEAIRVEYDLYYLLEASNLEGGVLDLML